MAELLWQWWVFNTLTGWHMTNPTKFYTGQEVADHINYMLKGTYEIGGSFESIEFFRLGNPVKYKWVLTNREER